MRAVDVDKGKPGKSQIGKRRVSAKRDSSERYTERRAALVAAAATLFREQGFDATSLDDIAKVAGVDRSSLYYYISSKKDLFYDVVGSAIEAVTLEGEAIRDNGKPVADRITDLLVAMMRSYSANYPHLYVFLQEDLSRFAAQKNPELRRLSVLGDRFDAIVRGLVDEGIAEGVLRDDISTTVIAQSIIGMANWTHRWFKPDGVLSAEQVGRDFAAIVLSGVGRS